jgi:hypothetical protein
MSDALMPPYNRNHFANGTGANRRQVVISRAPAFPTAAGHRLVLSMPRLEDERQQQRQYKAHDRDDGLHQRPGLDRLPHR